MFRRILNVETRIFCEVERFSRKYRGNFFHYNSTPDLATLALPLRQVTPPFFSLIQNPRREIGQTLGICLIEEVEF